jgi:hypothetical protein
MVLGEVSVQCIAFDSAGCAGSIVLAGGKKASGMDSGTRIRSTEKQDADENDFSV